MDNPFSLNMSLILSYCNVQSLVGGAQRRSHVSSENSAAPNLIKEAKAFGVGSVDESLILTKQKDES